MNSGAPWCLSVLVATRDRAGPLAELLGSLADAAGAAGCPVEVVVADNGSTDGTPALLAAWERAAAGRVVVREERPGKARALNRALAASRAPLLAFVDDDEVVTPGWAATLVRFAREHPEYAAACGSVLPPPSFGDPELRERLEWYRTIAFFDGGDAVRDLQTLYGGNMVVRRAVFEAVGGFDERLGPGALGGWEDVELARRILRAGLRIGYVPGAAVHHAVDPARLTPAYYREHCRVAARSAYRTDPGAWWRSVPRLVEAAAGFVVAGALGRRRARERARGRLIRHAEIVRLRFAGGRNAAGGE